VGLPSVPTFSGKRGFAVARHLVAGTPLEVVAGEVAVGREWVCLRKECLQRQAAWVWPLGTGPHARLELGCGAPMLATEGATKGGH